MAENGYYCPSFVALKACQQCWFCIFFLLAMRKLTHSYVSKINKEIRLRL